MGSAGFIAPARRYVEHALDADQRAVVELPPGSSAVVVGAPGTGKSTALIELVAARVAAGQSLDAMLVLSPSRATASRLREQLAQRLSTASNGALARTPMAVAFEVLALEAATANMPLPRLLTGAEQDGLIAEWLEGQTELGRATAWPETLPADVRASRVFRSELRELIARCDDYGISPVALADYARRQGDAVWAAAAEFWGREYVPIKASYKAEYFSTAELLREASALIAGGHALAHIELVLIDDAQELTYGDMNLARALVARGANVVAFGNPDQATTSFRGALPAMLGRFATDVAPGAATMGLHTIYRFGEPQASLIAALAERVGAQQSTLQRRVDAVRGDGGEVTVLQRSSPSAEISAVARLLRQHHVREGIPFSRMAVVVRTGRLVAEVARGLAVAEVPTRTLISETQLNEEPIVRDLAAFVRAALAPERLDVAAVNTLLLSPLTGLTPIDVRRLRLALRQESLAAGYNELGSTRLVDAFTKPFILADVQTPAARRAVHVIETLDTLRAQIAAGSSIEELLWTVWSRAGVAETWRRDALGTGLTADAANRQLDAVLAFFTSAKRFVEREPAGSAEKYLDEFFAAQLPEDSLTPQAAQSSVLVATPTALMGSEFDVVAVVSVQEGTWPNVRLRGTLLRPQDIPGAAVGMRGEGSAGAAAAGDLPTAQPERTVVDDRKAVLHDEIRMLLLACSRSRQHLIVSAHASEDELPSPFMRLLAACPGVSLSGLSAPQSEAAGVVAPSVVSEHPFTLRGLVGALRRRLTTEIAAAEGAAVLHPARSLAELSADEAAAALGQLAHAGVPGADPADWYGLVEPSTDQPLIDLSAPDAEVWISPSRLETFHDSPLNWFISTHTGHENTVYTGIGTIVHKALEDASTVPGMTVDEMKAAVEERWHEIAFDAEWESSRQRARVDAMIDAIAEYVELRRSEGVTVVGVEANFTLKRGHAVLNGQADRLEQLADGSVRVVDLKTGKNAPSHKSMAEHAQLAAYQFALVNGGFVNEGLTDNPRSAGALLLYPAKPGNGTSYSLREQPALSDPDEIAAFEATLQETAQGMAAASFTANVYTREEIGSYDSAYEMRIHVVRGVCE